MHKFLIILITVSYCLITSSCNKDEVIVTVPPPEVILESGDGIYSVKRGRELTIAPSFKNVENATYCWYIEDKLVWTKPSYSFTPESAGTIYIKLVVSTEYGSERVEIKVNVLELEIPTVSLAGAEGGFTIIQGGKITFDPIVKEVSIPTAYHWYKNGDEVSNSKSYLFNGDEIGEYEIVFKAVNEDGEDSIAFDVNVCDAADMPFGWKFEKERYYLSSGRAVVLQPVEIINGDNAKYEWLVNGKSIEGESGPSLLFNEKQEGEYVVTLTAILENAGSTYSLSQELYVEVCPPEGRYYRQKTGSSLAQATKVYEYTPAPGQFINETVTSGFTGAERTPETACRYAEERIENNLFVSLGGFGGYIIVGFDHSIENSGEYDFSITGNSFDGSSEPGIVWVMQDENGDGLPNDNWYELKGCEEENPQTIRNYAVTYYRPSGSGMAVQWLDNLGNSGEIDYLVQFHKQESYYPAWIEEESYTLRGTRLEAKNYDKSDNGTYWVQPGYEWGYADNFSPVDRFLPGSSTEEPSARNHFRISDAIDTFGAPAELKYIDFIKVQTALNTKSGWLGENSTEVVGFHDCSIE